MIELERLSKTYAGRGLSVPGVREIDLRVAQGTFVAITGKSGCGKTTLLNLIGLIDRFDSGSYTLDGLSLRDASEGRLTGLRQKYFGYVFQSFHLLPSLTALENIAMPLGYFGVPKAKRNRMAEEALQKVGLLDKRRAFPTRLSGGEQQRVAIARAIVHHPAILLADEPTGNLDSASGEQIMDLFAALHHEGVTILLVTHDPQFAKRAERVVCMSDARIVSDTAALSPRP